MLIESLDPTYSDQCLSATCDADQGKVINAFVNLLLKMGWTLTDRYFATADIYYGAGLPIVTPPPSPVVKSPVGCSPGCFLQIGGLKFNLYDPYREYPTAGPCIFVPIGTSQYLTASNLASAIGASTPFIGLAKIGTPGSGGGFTITLMAETAGPEFNFYSVIADKVWGYSNDFTTNGGYQFTSKSETGYPQVVFDIIGGDFSIDGQIRFNFNGQLYYLYQDPPSEGFPIAIGQYTIIANAYSFVMFASSQADNLTVACMAAFAPYQSTDFSPIPTWFALGPGSFRRSTYFNGAVTCSYNGIQCNPGGGTASPFPRLLAPRCAGSNLIGFNKQPIVSAAYVSYAGQMSDSAAVVGSLTDVIIVNATLPGGLEFQGKNFTALGWQTGSGAQTPSTWLMRNDKNISNPAGPSTGSPLVITATVIDPAAFTIEFTVSGGQSPYVWDSIPGAGSILPPSWTDEQTQFESTVASDGSSFTLTYPIGPSDDGQWSMVLTVSDQVFVLDPSNLDHKVTQTVPFSITVVPTSTDISVSPTSVSLDSNNLTSSVTVTNSGSSAHEVDISCNLSCITAPSGMDIAGGASAPLDITLVPGSLVAGQYTGQILLTVAGQDPIQVQIVVTILTSTPAKSGYVNIFGQLVSWVSGDQFDKTMEGKPITVDSIGYTVKTVTDAQTIVLLPWGETGPPKSNVPYTA